MENVKYIPGDLVTLDVFADEILRVISVSSPAHGWGHNENVYTLERPDGNVFSSKEQYLRDIPLTSQILETNGYEELSDSYIYVYFIENYVDEYDIQIDLNPDYKEEYEVEIQGVPTTKIHYVHELQHLLFGLGLDSSLKV